MSFVLRENASHSDLTTLAKLREKQGYEVTWISPNEIEVNSDGMIDDRMGIVVLTKI